MKKIILFILAIVIVFGVYVWLGGKKSTKPQTPEVPIGSGMPVPGETGALETIVGSESIITYTDNGYSPADINIKAGETVTFKNKSSKNMWPASAKHPTHEIYPTTGGCLGSTFDACKAVPPGQSWSFKFDIKGTWKYHDHLSPTYFGSILVN